MSLIINAQDINMAQNHPEDPETVPHVHLDGDLVVYDELPDYEQVLEVYQDDHDQEPEEGHEIEIYDEPEEQLSVQEEPESESAPEEEIPVASLTLTLSAIPGAEEDTGEPVEKVEIDEHDNKSPWDYSASDDFAAWVEGRLNEVPKHSGKAPAGLERAIAYLQKFKSELSRLVRSDFDGKIDISIVDKVFDEIHNGIERLEERLEQVNEKYTKKKKKKAHDQHSLIKEGQKATHVGGIIVTVPLLISRLARICINGHVSAGHEIEDLYRKQVKKFALSDREQAELLQLLYDMNYPLRMDRLYDFEETSEGKVDLTSSDNGDYAANYPA